MSLQKTIYERMVNAIKSGDKEGRTIYRFLKGKLDNAKTQPVPDNEVVQLLRQLVVDAGKNPGTFSEREVELMKAMVPPTLDEEAIRQYLVETNVSEQIKTCANEGQAIGIAMRVFTQGKRCVDGATVREVIKTLRSA